MTRLTCVVGEPGTVADGRVVSLDQPLPTQGIVYLDVRGITRPASEIIGEISHHIAKGTAPDEVRFISNSANEIGEFNEFLS